MSETDGKPTEPGGPDSDDVVDAELVEDPPPASANLPATIDPTLESSLEPDYTTAGVPTFDYVRDRIEGRYNTSAGATELAGLGTEQTVESLDKQMADRDKAGRDKLEEIRRQMRGE